MLTLQNHVSLRDLNVVGPLNGAFKARAWDTFRAVAQAVTHSRGVTPGSEDIAVTNVDKAPLRILARGLERC